MYVSGLLHRERFFALASWWLSGAAEPEDGVALSEIFLLDPWICAPQVIRCLEVLQQRLRPGSLGLRAVRCKDEVRRAMVGAWSQEASLRHLFTDYESHPESYFPGHPVQAAYAWVEARPFWAMLRLKGLTRVATKAQWLLADVLGSTIRSTARTLAENRAWSAGVSMEQLLSSPETMALDFAQAERLVSYAIRDGRMSFTADEGRIDDFWGLKVVDTWQKLEEGAAFLGGQAEVVEKDGEGHLTASSRSLLLELERPDLDSVLARLDDPMRALMDARGLRGQVAADRVARYWEQGEASFWVELVLHSPHAVVASDFGPQVHEELILRQRREASYRGRLAENLGYIFMDMLRLAAAQGVEVGQAPKLWGRYLPELWEARPSRQAADLGGGLAVANARLLERCISARTEG